jgi:uncharacterized protein YdbL (DUF1318 family)
MRKKIIVSLMLFLFAGSGLLTTTAFADSSETLKKRMQGRAGQVLELLKAGKLGENYLGFLAEKEALSDAQKAIMGAENNDRNQVYKAIADKNGTGVDAVGSLRAKQIRGNLPGGIWVQKAPGKWSKT